MDFVTGLPLSNGHTVILTMVDRLSKAVHFVPLTKLPLAAEMGTLLVQHVFQLHGFPKDIVSDRAVCGSVEIILLRTWGGGESFLRVPPAVQ